MGCHIFNAMYRGLELTAPRKVRSKTRTPNQHNWTTNERVEYLFPATRHTDGNLTSTGSAATNARLKPLRRRFLRASNTGLVAC